MPVLEGEVLSLLLLVLSFASLFYTYAAALKKNEKGINKITFFLLMITIVFFVALIIKDFEILKQKESYELFTFCLLPMLFGLYIGHYAVYKTIWISLRNIAWTPFLLMCIFFFVTLLSAIIFYSLEILNKLLTSIVTAIILYFLSSFIISCLIGMVCKYFKKNQAEAQTNE